MEYQLSHKIGFFICLFLFLAPANLYAQVIISEIMYDVEGTDTGREWIEIHNIGQDPVDLSTWKLFEANTNHKLTTGGQSQLSAGGFAIITDVSDKFQSDHAGFNGQIFDSAFSLSNEGETVVIRDASLADIDSVSYIPTWGAGGNGFSLQRTLDGRWVAATPTPGTGTVATQSEVLPVEVGDSGATDNVSSTTSTGNISNNTESITYASYSSQSIANTAPDAVELVVTSGRPRLGFVGIPLDFRAKTKKTNDTSSDLEHSWSMGDGTLKHGSIVSHSYKFPGDYTVVLNSRGKDIEGVSRTKVKILNPAVSILSANAVYVEISNSSEYELNIGEMLLRTLNNKTILPTDTVIAPHSIIRLPSISTHLRELHEFVSLESPAGDIFAKVTVTEPVILLPDGLDLGGIRGRITDALKTHGK